MKMRSKNTSPFALLLVLIMPFRIQNRFQICFIREAFPAMSKRKFYYTRRHSNLSYGKCTYSAVNLGGCSVIVNRPGNRIVAVQFNCSPLTLHHAFCLVALHYDSAFICSNLDGLLYRTYSVSIYRIHAYLIHLRDKLKDSPNGLKLETILFNLLSLLGFF